MAFYRDLRRTSRMGSDEIAEMQRRKLEALIRHCRDNVPFYQRRFAELGLSSGELGAEDLGKLPKVEREDVRGAPDAFKAKGYEASLIRYSTGGSTGSPLVFYTDKIKEARHNAYKLACRSWLGVRPGDRQVDFWGSPIELGSQTAPRALKDRWLLNRVLLSAFDLGKPRLERYVAFVKRFRPRLIYGYPTVIYRIARLLEDSHDRLGFTPRAVVCTSEMLYSEQRDVIARVLGCPVANEYGARDGGLIAHECAKGRLHVAAGHVHVEVDGPDADGVGDLLVSNLDGYGFPLLRYRIGDRGRLAGERCDCGINLPVLAELAGRRNDFLVGGNGKLLHSVAASYIMREIPGIEQYKVIQHPDLHLEILVVGEPLADHVRATVRSRMLRTLGLETDIEIRMVDVIPPERSGKYRWIVSHAKGARA